MFFVLKKKTKPICAVLAALLLAAAFSGCAKQIEDDVVVIGTPAATDAHSAGTPAPADATEPPTEATEIPPTDIPATEAPVGEIPPITSVSGKYQTYEGTNVLRVDDRAYEICYFLEAETNSYAKLIGEAAKMLEGRTNVYDLIIPTAYGVMMPDDMREKISFYFDLGEKIEQVYSQMDPAVKTVSCYDTLMHHRDEFIYFRTDHHWTARGAYYAYAEFCRKKGVEPYPLDSHRTVDFDGFLGTLYKDSGNDGALMPAETVTAYYPATGEVTMTVYDNDGHGVKYPIVTDVTNYSAIAKYNTFAGSDNPITEFVNPVVTDGSVCIIIKESFGNAMLAFLVDHYSKVYEIDYRYWKGNVIELAKEVNATDLIFANNFMMISSKSNIGKLSMIVK